MRQLSPIGHRANEFLRFIDLKHFRKAQKLRKKVETMFPWTKAFGVVDPCVYEGKEILLNVQSLLHTDRFDPQYSWSIIYCAGSHTGGYLYLPHLGLRIRMLPGDMVMIRGRVLKHMVEKWSGGQRISIPHFTHSSVWRMMKMDAMVGAEEDGKEGDDDEEEWEDV